MKRQRRLSIIVALLAAVLTVGTTWAVRAGAYDLSWWTVDAGGTTFSAAEGYALGATIGQPDAAVLTGRGYTLAGGFWGGGVAAAVELDIYLPLVLRGY